VARVIFSDGGSSDDIAEIADDTGATLVTGPAGRGAQLRLGAELAHSPWLLFLHADSRLPENWSRAVADHIRADAPAAAFRLAFDSTAIGARITAGWANLRGRIFGLPYGDQGLLISHQAYKAASGYDPIPLMEDVALARRLRPRPVLLPAVITTSAAGYERSGWLRRGTRNLSILLRYLMGASPERLYREYYK